MSFCTARVQNDVVLVSDTPKRRRFILHLKKKKNNETTSFYLPQRRNDVVSSSAETKRRRFRNLQMPKRGTCFSFPNFQSAGGRGRGRPGGLNLTCDQ